jgi:hypothetical protein
VEEEEEEDGASDASPPSHTAMFARRSRSAAATAATTAKAVAAQLQLASTIHYRTQTKSFFLAPSSMIYDWILRFLFNENKKYRNTSCHAVRVCG